MKIPVPHPRVSSARGNFFQHPTTLNVRPGETVSGEKRRNQNIEAHLRREVARSIEETFGKD